MRDDACTGRLSTGAVHGTFDWLKARSSFGPSAAREPLDASPERGQHQLRQLVRAGCRRPSRLELEGGPHGRGREPWSGRVVGRSDDVQAEGKPGRPLRGSTRTGLRRAPAPVGAAAGRLVVRPSRRGRGRSRRRRHLSPRGVTTTSHRRLWKGGSCRPRAPHRALAPPARAGRKDPGRQPLWHRPKDTGLSWPCGSRCPGARRRRRPPPRPWPRPRRSEAPPKRGPRPLLRSTRRGSSRPACRGRARYRPRR